MIGSSTLKLNEATMVEVVQYWLTNKFLNKDEPSPKVTEVKGGGGGYGNEFSITLSHDQQ